MKSLEAIFDPDGKLKELEEIEVRAQDPALWEDRTAAEALMKKKASLSEALKSHDALKTLLEDAEVLLSLASEESDEAAAIEAGEKLDEASSSISAVEVHRMLGGESDRLNAIVSIHPGAGGTEAQDWADMLLRMYLRWAERRDYSAKTLDYIPGDEAGIKSVTFSVTGEYAYGYLKAEVGVHRLVRISPYDAAKRRHTSFASVFVYPEVEGDVDVEVFDADLRVDTYRASGAGGQHVNKTDSAVRITHIPTGIVVQCQNERSQHKNRAVAMKILRARLYERKLKEEEEKVAELHKGKQKIEWGSQIRSYVLQPYRMVKDHRTSHESGNVEGVLDGNIDMFIESYLLSGASKG